MIKLETNCNDCMHNKLCKFRGNAESDFKKLNNMTYGDGPNNDYDWSTILASRHVDVTFSCPDFKKLGPTYRNFS